MHYSYLSMFVCVLLTQGAPSMTKILEFMEEVTCQQSSIYVHHLQHFLHEKH